MKKSLLLVAMSCLISMNAAFAATKSSASVTVNGTTNVTLKVYKSLCGATNGAGKITGTATAYEWYATAAPGTLLGSLDSIGTLSSTPGNYYVVVHRTGWCDTTINFIVTDSVAGLTAVATSNVPNDSTYLGTSVTFTSNDVTATAYQWYVDGVVVPGAIAATYMNNTLTAANHTVYSRGQHGTCWNSTNILDMVVAAMPSTTITQLPAAGTTISACTNITYTITVVNSGLGNSRIRTLASTPAGAMVVSYRIGAGAVVAVNAATVTIPNLPTGAVVTLVVTPVNPGIGATTPFNINYVIEDTRLTQEP